MGKVIIINQQKQVLKKPRSNFTHSVHGIIACALVILFSIIGINALTNVVYTHAVDVDPNFGTGVIDTFTVTQGSKLTLPIPEKPFYTFAGWFEDKELTIPFNTKTDTVKKSMTLYGKWSKNEYTITFIDPRFIDTETKGVIKTTTNEFGKGFSFPTPADATDENFRGWSVYMRGAPISRSNESSRVFATPEQNITFYAIWFYDFWAYSRPTIPVETTLTVLFNFQDVTEVFYYDTDPTVTNQFNERIVSSTQIIDLPTMLGVSAMNNGYKTYSFGGWAIGSPNPNAPVFRDGQTLAIGNWLDYAQGDVLEVFALWI